MSATAPQPRSRPAAVPEPSNHRRSYRPLVTTWVENPEGGRERGARGLVRAWYEVLVRPRRFFANGVAPGDQAPGLVFAVAVTVVYAGSRFVFVPGSRPALFADPGASVLVGLLVAALIVAPVVLHLVAAVQTLVLVALVDDRAGVSETVQVLAYAAAPCALAGVGAHPALLAAVDPGLEPAVLAAVAGWRLLCACWSAGLLVVGLSVVHEVSVPRAAVAAALPALAVFGYGFGGVVAFETVTGLDLVGAAGPTGG